MIASQSLKLESIILFILVNRRYSSKLYGSSPIKLHFQCLKILKEIIRIWPHASLYQNLKGSSRDPSSTDPSSSSDPSSAHLKHGGGWYRRVLCVCKGTQNWRQRKTHKQDNLIVISCGIWKHKMAISHQETKGITQYLVYTAMVNGLGFLT
jgi:hypothetical protein